METERRRRHRTFDYRMGPAVSNHTDAEGIDWLSFTVVLNGKDRPLTIGSDEKASVKNGER